MFPMECSAIHLHSSLPGDICQQHRHASAIGVCCRPTNLGKSLRLILNHVISKASKGNPPKKEKPSTIERVWNIMEYQHVNHNHQSLPRTLHSLPLRTCRDRTWRKLLGKHMQYHVNPEACHLPISHWQHCSLAVHIPVPEAIRIMSEECTRLPKKTPMKITDIMLPGNWRTK